MVFHSTTDEGIQIPERLQPEIQIPHLLPPGPNKNTDVDVPNKDEKESSSVSTSAEEQARGDESKPFMREDAEAQAGRGEKVAQRNESMKTQAEENAGSQTNGPEEKEAEPTMEPEQEAQIEEHIQTMHSRSRHTIIDEDGRERMEAMVADFAKSAVRGCPCTFFDHRTGKRTPAMYYLNKDVTQITIMEKTLGRRSIFKRGFGLPFDVPLACILDVDNFEGCMQCLDTKVLKNLSDEDKARLLMVFYESKKGNRTLIFTLILDSVESRDSFQQSVNCLKVAD